METKEEIRDQWILIKGCEIGLREGILISRLINLSVRPGISLKAEPTGLPED